MTICRQCSSAFEITPEDMAFYEQVSPVFNGKKALIPPPTLCPDCRHQRRHTWRNERNLYHRKCDLSGKQIISIYSPDKMYKVYGHQEWWSDQWDPLSYGRDFDFSRTFFDQFNNLMMEVPRLALHSASSDNSDYVNFASNCKNCYMTFIAFYGCENVYHSYRIYSSKDCMDCSFCERIERCYECVSSHDLYNCVSCFRCSNSHDCLFSAQLRSCSNCMFCVNLNNASYCIFNKQYSKEEYEQKREEFTTGSFATKQTALKQYDALRSSMVVRDLWNQACEDSLGDDLLRCKNVTHCFACFDVEDSKYSYGMEKAHHVYDSIGGDFSWCYQCNITGLDGANCIACNVVLHCHDMYYCDQSNNSSNCFGSIALNRKKYCILNKQYTKEEYNELVPRIIEHMKNTGEWGEFFPETLSPFGYNETDAQEYFPLTKEEVTERGWKWFESEVQEHQYLGPQYDIPDSIESVSSDITKQILRCEVTGKPYKIIPQELAFYKEHSLPIPRKCPDQRHKERIAMRNPRKLWGRNCMNCQKTIQTTYSPDRPEIVYCEECYLSTVY